MSSSSSVGVKSDMVEMLSAGDETAVVGILTKVSEEEPKSSKMEGGLVPCKAEEGKSVSVAMVGRFWGTKVVGVSACAGDLVAAVSSPSSLHSSVSVASLSSSVFCSNHAVRISRSS